jgi:hypothetical protein
LYGKKFNGYMGVGIAYPLKEFETIKVDICRLSDEKEDDWPRPPEEGEDGVITKVRSLASYTVQSTTELLQNYIGKHLGTDFRLLLGLSKETIDPWEMSENRYNVLLTVALRFRDDETRGVFSISNYHMPWYVSTVYFVDVDILCYLL